MQGVDLIGRYFDPRKLPADLRNADRDLRHLLRFACAKSFADMLWAAGGIDAIGDLIAGGRQAFIARATVMYGPRGGYVDLNFTLSDFDWMWDQYLEPRAHKLLDAHKSALEKLKQPAKIRVSTGMGLDGEATDAPIEQQIDMKDVMEAVRRGQTEAE